MNPTRARVAILSGAVLLSGLMLFSASDAHNWTAPLKTEAEKLGKASWHPMLKHLAGMHANSTHAPAAAFELPWEDTGTGYGLGPAFGHWDLVHEVLDVLPAAPEHARDELLNDVRLQLTSGFLPGLFWMNAAGNAGRRPRFDRKNSHPPVWVLAAGEYVARTGDRNLAREFFGMLHGKSNGSKQVAEPCLAAICITTSLCLSGRAVLTRVSALTIVPK